MKDGGMKPDGTFIMSPKGSVALDPKDSIVAGTNLFGGGSSGVRQVDTEQIRRDRNQERLVQLGEKHTQQNAEILEQNNK